MNPSRIGMGVLGLMGLFLALWLFWEREVNPNTCESICMTNEICMRALADEGIAPFGSTKDDRGLCNGICASLRSQERESAQLAKEFAMERKLADHPCMPRP